MSGQTRRKHSSVPTLEPPVQVPFLPWYAGNKSFPYWLHKEFGLPIWWIKDKTTDTGGVWEFDPKRGQPVLTRRDVTQTGQGGYPNPTKPTDTTPNVKQLPKLDRTTDTGGGPPPPPEDPSPPPAELQFFTTGSEPWPWPPRPHPPGNDIVEKRPGGRGTPNPPSHLEFLVGRRQAQRWTNHWDPCKQLANRSHGRNYRIKSIGRRKAAQQQAIRLTYWNRSRCNK